MSDPNKPWQFKAGWKGGPGRKPGTKIISKSLREILESDAVNLEITQVDKAGKKKVQKYDLKVDKNITYALSVALIREGLKGDVRALKEIYDRIDGKAVQAVEIFDCAPDEMENMSQEELKSLRSSIVSKLASQEDEENKTDKTD